MNWINDILGTELSNGWQIAIVTGAVLLALLVLIWIFRKFTGRTHAAISPQLQQTRLQVTDAAIVDDHRRLILVRRDNVEHLVLIGGPTDVVIEQNIGATRSPAVFDRSPPAGKRSPAPQRHARAPALTPDSSDRIALKETDENLKPKNDPAVGVAGNPVPSVNSAVNTAAMASAVNAEIKTTGDFQSPTADNVRQDDAVGAVATPSNEATHADKAPAPPDDNKKHPAQSSNGVSNATSALENAQIDVSSDMKETFYNKAKSLSGDIASIDTGDVVSPGTAEPSVGTRDSEDDMEKMLEELVYDNNNNNNNNKAASER